MNLISYVMCKTKEAYPNTKINANITTNGYLLDGENATNLLKIGVNSFQITIDGNKENHDSSRVLKNGFGTYDVIVSNLLNLKASASDYKVIIRANISKETNMDGFFETYATLFGNDKRFSLLLYPISDWGKSICQTLLDKKDIFSIYTKTLSKMNINDEYQSIYLKEFLGCQYSLPNSVVIMPDSTIDFCTIKFNSERKTISDQSNELSGKIADDCLKTDCPIYPKCLGFRCHKSDINYCNGLIDEIKAYIKEKFA